MERVRQRLLLASRALKAAGVPNAVAGDFFRPFAPSFVGAVRKLAADVARLSGGAWVPLASAGEDEPAPLARLRSVRRMKDEG